MSFINPGASPLVQLAQPGTLNTLNPALTLRELITRINFFASGESSLPAVSGFGMTIPAQQLATPMAHHYDM